MNQHLRQILMALAVAGGLCAWDARGQAPTDAPSDRSNVGHSTQPEPADRPTAEDILRELRNREPGNEVIPPASWEGGTAPPATPKLLPEGTAVVDVAGHVERDGEWWVFVFDTAAVKARYGFEPTTDQVKLLPNSALEGVVRMARASPSPQPFALSGEMSVYRGENYLLIRSAARSDTAGTPRGRQLGHVESQQVPAEDAEALAGPAVAGPVAPGGSGPANQPVPADASAEDVLEKMKQLGPARGTMAPSTPAKGPADDELSSASAPVFEGTAVVRRTGRLVPQGEWWAFAFDTDHGAEGEQPLRLLPNQSLQFMVDLYERSPAGLVFTVSGEVTEFAGRNYLLTRAVTRRLDLGNLRR